MSSRIFNDKITDFLKRNRRKSAHLYETGKSEGDDFIVCPVTGARVVMLRRDYIEKTLGIPFPEFKQRFPDQSLMAESRRRNIKAGLAVVDPVTGKTAHETSVVKSTISRAEIGADGLSTNKRKARKTREAHLTRIDENGRNGYERLAHYRNTTLTESGLSVQAAALLKRAEKAQSRNGLKGASKASRRDLAPLLDILDRRQIKYYFDKEEYGIKSGSKYYYYDLTIPLYCLAVEYRGKNFHPDQSLTADEWSSWRQTFTGKTADEVHAHDLVKARALHTHRGFQVWSIYEKDAATQVANLLDFLNTSYPPVGDFVVNDDWEILTPTGWQDFTGTIIKGVAPIVTVSLEDDRAISGTRDHAVYQNGVAIPLSSVRPGDWIDTEDGGACVAKVRGERESITYDLVEVSGDHRFFVNDGIQTKNCDEFAFVPPNKAQEFWVSIQPVLSTGGSCIVTSTPKSDEDQFAQIWKGANDTTDAHGNPNETGVGKNGFFAVSVPWDRHPERDEEWAKPFRESLGEARFRQEFACEFVSDDLTLINPLCLTRLTSTKPEFYTGHVRWFKAPEANRTYLVGLDPSMGVARDYAAIQVFELPGMIQVAEWQHNETIARGQIAVMMQILHFIDQTMRDDPDQHGEPTIYWTVENNSLGEAVLQIIDDTGEERFPGQFVSERKRKGQVRRFRKGLNTDNRKKLTACAKAKSLIESGRMTCNSQQIIKQLKFYVGTEGGRTFGAKPGEHDDLVSAMLLCVRMLETVAHQGEEIGDLREHIEDGELFESEPMPILL